MRSFFPRVDSSLRADSALRSTLGITIALMLGVAWMTWAFCAHLTRFEMSDSARLEVDSAVAAVQASTSGRVAVNYLTLGREVQAGDLLLELDNRAEQLSLAEQQTRLAAIQPQIAALESQMHSEQLGRTDERKVLTVSHAAAQAQYEQANADALLAEQEWSRASQLRKEGILSVADAEKARTTAATKRAAANSMKAAMDRLEPELDVRERDREIQSRKTYADLTKLQADQAATAAEVKRLEFEIERRRIRASTSGRLGECAVLRAGSHIAEGDRLGIIVPSGKLQVVAEFDPSAALGKVRVGQSGTLRLNGFPWAQYGVVRGQVSRVADEIRDGKVRVELAVNSGFPGQIPPQHGLPGALEIEVERLTPAALILRSAGQMVGAK